MCVREKNTTTAQKRVSPSLQKASSFFTFSFLFDNIHADEIFIFFSPGAYKQTNFKQRKARDAKKEIQ